MAVHLPLSGEYLCYLRIFSVLCMGLCNHLVYRRPHGTPTPEEQAAHGSDNVVGPFLARVPTPHIVIMYALSLFDAYTTLCSLHSESSWTHLAVYSLVAQNSFRPTFTYKSLIWVILAYSGTYLRLLCYGVLGECFTFEVAIRQNHRLYTHGPYSIIRHPGYLAVLVANAGTGLMLFGEHSTWMTYHLGDTLFGRVVMTYWVMVQLLTVWCFFDRMGIEDKELEKHFGEEWVRWSIKVPYKVLPYIY